MNKVAILGDLHFGIKHSSKNFNGYFEKFYSNIFFPILQEQNIKTIIQLGDLFDNRKSLNLNEYFLCKQYFFDKLKEYDLEMITLIGNHDTYFRNTVKVNSPKLILHNYDNIRIIDSPEKITINGVDTLFIPWICDENEEECLKLIKNPKVDFCFGHFEIRNFSMYKGIENYDGLNPELFSKFEFVFSGHFHTRSYRDNIYFVGIPSEHTWNDYDDQKGFHIFDFDERKLTFFENPYKMFHKIYYDKNNDYSSLEKYKDTVIKVQVKKCDEDFNIFLDKLTSVNPFDIIIMEEEEIYNNEENIDEMKNTLSFMNEYIDGILTPDIEIDDLKKVMYGIYMEATNI